MKFNSKNISILLNIILGLLLITLIVLLFVLRIIPPFSDTEDTISDIPEFNSNDSKVERVVEDLEIPWDVEFIGDNTILITERIGKVQISVNGEKLDEPALDLTDEVVAIGEAGLMGMTKSPDFEEDNLIYLYHTYESGEEVFLKVVSYEFENNKLINEQLIINRIPTGSVHSGGQIEFGPDGKLYITTGDVGDAELAQNMGSLAGKTLRINPDGTYPEDNPYIWFLIEETQMLDKGFDPRWVIYSLGHRNAQGLDWHPETNLMYQSEHGPSGFDGGTGMDEINIVYRSSNLGWPTIRGDETNPEMYSPLLIYTPAIAPASAHFYKGEMFPELQNSLLVGMLRASNILVVSTRGESAQEEFRLLTEDYGRIRYVTEGPDGAIYFTTSNTDGRGNPEAFDDAVYKIYRD